MPADATTVIVTVSFPGEPLWRVPVTLPEGVVGNGWTEDRPGQRSPPPAVASRARLYALHGHTIAHGTPPDRVSQDVATALRALGGSARTAAIVHRCGHDRSLVSRSLPYVARRLRRGVWSLP